MIFEYISLIFGIIKTYIYKILNPTKIHFKGIPKINSSFKIAIKKNSKLYLGKKFRSRYNVSFRIYNKGKVTIGNNCFFNDGCSINCQDEIIIGNNVICGQNVMLFDHDHDYKNNINNFVTKKITIGNNVWIGANSIILKGVTIGDNVVIAANTVVKENIESNVLVYNTLKLQKKKIDLNKTQGGDIE